MTLWADNLLGLKEVYMKSVEQPYMGIIQSPIPQNNGDLHLPFCVLITQSVS